jgi:hypothetical protein
MKVDGTILILVGRETLRSVVNKYYDVLGGRKLTDLTIKEIIDLQRSGDLFAVGRYQMIGGEWEDGVWKWPVVAVPLSQP